MSIYNCCHKNTIPLDYIVFWRWRPVDLLSFAHKQSGFFGSFLCVVALANECRPVCSATRIPAAHPCLLNSQRRRTAYTACSERALVRDITPSLASCYREHSRMQMAHCFLFFFFISTTWKKNDTGYMSKTWTREREREHDGPDPFTVLHFVQRLDTLGRHMLTWW